MLLSYFRLRPSDGTLNGAPCHFYLHYAYGADRERLLIKWVLHYMFFVCQSLIIRHDIISTHNYLIYWGWNFRSTLSLLCLSTGMLNGALWTLNGAPCHFYPHNVWSWKREISFLSEVLHCPVSKITTPLPRERPTRQTSTESFLREYNFFRNDLNIRS